MEVGRMTQDQDALRQQWEQHHEGWTTEAFVENDEAGRDDAAESGAFVIFATRDADGERIAGTGQTPEEALEALRTAAMRLRSDPPAS
jgi:hypothetical protein